MILPVHPTTTPDRHLKNCRWYGYAAKKKFQWLEDKNIEGYVKHNQFDGGNRTRLTINIPLLQTKLHNKS